MPVTEVDKNIDALTMTITAEFDADAERLWELWSDPRQLERWWGPPSHPSTFVEHELTVGARTTYFMTGPDGEKHHGTWRIEEVEPPRRLRLTRSTPSSAPRGRDRALPPHHGPRHGSRDPRRGPRRQRRRPRRRCDRRLPSDHADLNGLPTSPEAHG